MSTGRDAREATASRSAEQAGARESEDLPVVPGTPYPVATASWIGRRHLC